MVLSNQIQNCTITSKGMTNTKVICGPQIVGVSGKTVRCTPKRVDSDCVAIPREFQLLHKSITLVSYVFFVNGIPFLITLSRNIHFVTVEHILSRTANQLSRSLSNSCSLYVHASYNVYFLSMDMDFDPVDSKIPHVAVNKAAVCEHVGEI